MTFLWLTLQTCLEHPPPLGESCLVENPSAKGKLDCVRLERGLAPVRFQG